jgi:ribonuclease Z
VNLALLGNVNIIVDRGSELLDKNKITVITCGTSSAIPSTRAQSCTAVFVNGMFLLFDAGDGAARSMQSLGIPLQRLDAIFITHYHDDHIADVGTAVNLGWVLGRLGPLPVYGGTGLERIVGGFNRIYALDNNYRRAHHGEEIFPTGSEGISGIEIANPGPGGKVVYESNGVTVTAYEVDHSPITPAFGYRVDYAGKSVAISGDTINTEGLRNLSKGADILVSEVINQEVVEAMECMAGRIGMERNAKILRDIRSYHIDIKELAKVASDAGVGKLVLTHLAPTVDDPAQIDVVFRDPATPIFSGELIIAEDGTEVIISIH